MLTGLRSNLHDIAEARLDAAARAFLSDPRIKTPDFSVPEGEPALVSPDSVSWRIFKNPVTLFIGGVAAVFMEFADPRVRAGVWEHSNFRTDPVLRSKRTGLAAMITVYGPRSVAVKMIEMVTRMHARVSVNYRLANAIRRLIRNFSPGFRRRLRLGFSKLTTHMQSH